MRVLQRIKDRVLGAGSSARAERDVYDRMSRSGWDSGNEWVRKSSRIPGWLHPGEPDHLFRLAVGAPPGDVLEVGTWCGKTACIFAGSCIDRADGSSVLCVDTFLMDGTDGQRSYHRRVHPRRGTFYDFVGAAKELGFYDAVIPVAQFSARCVPRLKARLRLAFLDGRHDPAAVAEDLGLVADLVVPGGVVVLHDADANWPGVEEAAAAFFSDRADFRRHGHVGSCLSYERLNAER